MTVHQILEQVNRHKQVSRNQLYTYFKACQIKPIGAQQKPQRYPEDSAERIVEYLGFPKIVSMRTLKRARKKANGKRRAA